MCCDRESEVLCRDCELTALELELDVVGCLVRTYRYAADCVQELNPVDLENVRIVLRDNVAVFRILAHNETADYHCLAECEYCVLRVECYLYGLYILTDDCLEDGSRLLMEDK